ncbi:hypothetical protein QR66_10885 [Chromobacterium piscinae]|nr:hypothetical protein QR66_10885 [Chromobacterium piscinae]
MGLESAIAGIYWTAIHAFRGWEMASQELDNIQGQIEDLRQELRRNRQELDAIRKQVAWFAHEQTLQSRWPLNRYQVLTMVILISLGVALARLMVGAIG